MLCESENNACSVIDIISEFIEIAIHNILYLRKIYPQTIFEPARKYGVVVYHSIHPGINEYILNCLNTVRYHLRRNQLRSIILCFNSSEKVIEKYIFKIFMINTCFESDPFLVKFEQYLNNFCLKLDSSVNHLSKLPCDCIFSIQLQVTEYANIEHSQDELNKDIPWVDLGKNENNTCPKIIPVHNIEADFLNMQTYIEQLS